MAYRSLPRPSSPHDAKASIVCPYTLSKKLLELAKSRYVVILFNSKLPVVKEQTQSALSRMGNSGAVLIGGGSRIRTGDMLLAKQPLYQLSYTPENFSPPTRHCRLRRTSSAVGLPSVAASPK